MTDGDGRRLITLSRSCDGHSAGLRQTKRPALRRKGSVRLHINFAPEEQSAIQPLLRVPRLPRRRYSYQQPVLQLANTW
jgi:hypothetical protein